MKLWKEIELAGGRIGKVILETRGPDHIRQIREGLKKKGYSIQTLDQ